MKIYRARGYEIEVVEKWVPAAEGRKVRRDLWGCFDMAALRLGIFGTTYIQMTTRSNRSSHLKKILESPRARLAALTGNTLILFTWRPDGSFDEETLGPERFT